jgi:hypothetical protein
MVSVTTSAARSRDAVGIEQYNTSRLDCVFVEFIYNSSNLVNVKLILATKMTEM